MPKTRNLPHIETVLARFGAIQESSMKAYYLLAPLGAIAFTGCTVVRPVAYQPVVTPAPVAVAPAYVTPPASVLGAAPAPNPGEGEGPALSR